MQLGESQCQIRRDGATHWPVLRNERFLQRSNVFPGIALVTRADYFVTAEPPLKHMVLRGAAVVIAGNVIGQVLRLGGNLIMTRLLAPEVFGLLALVNVVVSGMQMLSDTGIRGTIVYHARGDDPTFLNTAWTVQIMRGLALWLITCVIAWPAAAFYEKSELLFLLPAVGLNAVIDGFASTARFTLTRRMIPARQVKLDLGARVLSLCAMVALALVWPSVWAMVAGGLTMTLVSTVGSHILIPGYANRLAFDREALRSLFGYGRWIFLSTGLAFLLSQGDRAFLGKVLTSEQLGVYFVAVVLADGLVQPIAVLSGSILQPLYARLVKLGSDELRRKTFRTRALLLSATIPIAWVFAIFGQQIIQILYDKRYWDAGWMLRILAVGAIGSILALTADRAILAVGNSQKYLMLQIARSILFVAGVVIGMMVGRLPGLLVGLSCANLLGYIPLALLLRSHGVWLPKLDLTALGLSAAVITLGVWIMGR